MELEELFPVWKQLTLAQQQQLHKAVLRRTVPKGTLLHNGAADCVGLFVMVSGVLRVFALSEGGKEITLYRLYERDICLFSAACILSSVQFDMQVQAQTDVELLIIPAALYKELMDTSLPVSRYTNELMASRFSEVMWLLDQVLHQRLDSRLAGLLLEEMQVQGTHELHITQEQLAGHLGSAREVVSRMMKYFEQEGAVKSSRGILVILDERRLMDWATGEVPGGR